MRFGRTVLRILVIPPLRSYFRHFPARAGKVIVWKYLAAHLWWLESRAKASTVFGGTLSVDARDICGRFIYYFGVWEPNLTAWIQSRLKPGDCFVDVGANVGYFSVLASSLVGDAGSVISVEAIPRTFDVLLSNLYANGARNARAINMAVWDKEETLTFYISSDTIDGTSTAMPGQAERWRLERSCDVRAAPLCSLLSRNEAAATRLIKIDVEGAEGRVVSGLTPILDNGRSDLEVVMEVAAGALVDIVALLRKHGFFPYHMENDYSVASYVGECPVKKPKRLETAPKDCEQVDVIFSRFDGASLS